ncbi:hypothetical protein VaNZ11_001260 [Volvox africanus]|uniref:BRCT domain-containing protein n=1 Tax=Volvox africanus TaxID=51714 RepID=A0ABQ5RPF2_9CHLO|nr:hypothetical protein VaNZ11_001260 [Volvox africanus]
MSTNLSLVYDNLRAGIFSGLAFIVHLAGPQHRGFPKDKDSFTNQLRKHVLKKICSNGGIVVGVEDRLVSGATHIIASHERQRVVEEAYQAQGQGACIQVYGPQWVLACIDNQQLIVNEQEYLGVMAGPHDPGVPGFRDFTNHIRVSGVPADRKDFRMLLLYWVECMGGRSANETAALDTSHVLTWNAGTLTPAQLEVEQRYPHVRHVHYTWLMHCRSSWEMVDDAPFRLVPPDGVSFRDESMRLTEQPQQHCIATSTQPVHGQQEGQQRQQECQSLGNDFSALRGTDERQTPVTATCIMLRSDLVFPDCGVRQPKLTPAARRLPVVKKEPSRDCGPAGPTQPFAIESGPSHGRLSCPTHSGGLGWQQPDAGRLVGSNLLDERPCSVPQSAGDVGSWIEFGNGSGCEGCRSRPDDGLQAGKIDGIHQQIPQPERQQQMQEGHEVKEQRQLSDNLVIHDGLKARRWDRASPGQGGSGTKGFLDGTLRLPLELVDQDQAPRLRQTLVPMASPCDDELVRSEKQGTCSNCNDHLSNTRKDFQLERPIAAAAAPDPHPDRTQPGYCPGQGPSVPDDVPTGRTDHGCGYQAHGAAGCLPSGGAHIQCNGAGANRLSNCQRNCTSTEASPVDKCGPSPVVQASDRQPQGIAEGASRAEGLDRSPYGLAGRAEGIADSSIFGLPESAPKHETTWVPVGPVKSPTRWRQKACSARYADAPGGARSVDDDIQDGNYGSEGGCRNGSGGEGRQKRLVCGGKEGSSQMEARKVVGTSCAHGGPGHGRGLVPEILDAARRSQFNVVQPSGPAPLKARPDASIVEAAPAAATAVAMDVERVGTRNGGRERMDEERNAPIDRPTPLLIDNNDRADKKGKRRGRGQIRRARMSDAKPPPAAVAAITVSPAEPGGSASGAAKGDKGKGDADQDMAQRATHVARPEEQLTAVQLRSTRADAFNHVTGDAEGAPEPGAGNGDECAAGDLGKEGEGCDHPGISGDGRDGRKDSMEVDLVQQHRAAARGRASHRSRARARGAAEAITAVPETRPPHRRKRPADSQTDSGEFGVTAPQTRDTRCPSTADPAAVAATTSNNGAGVDPATRTKDAAEIGKGLEAGVDGESTRQTAKRRRRGQAEAAVPVDTTRTAAIAATSANRADTEKPRQAGCSTGVDDPGPRNSADAATIATVRPSGDVQAFGKGADAVVTGAAEENCGGRNADSQAGVVSAGRRARTSRKQIAGSESPPPDVLPEAGCDLRTGGGRDDDNRRGSCKSQQTYGICSTNAAELGDQEPQPQPQLGGMANTRKASATKNATTGSLSSPPEEEHDPNGASEDPVVADVGEGTVAAVPAGPSRKAKGRGNNHQASFNDTAVFAVAATQPGASQRLQGRSGGSCTSPLGKSRKLVFALSGFTAEERARYAATLKALHLPYVPVNNDWDPRINALLAPSLKRSDKTVCAMAAGAWLLRADYLSACQGLAERESGETTVGPGTGVAPEDFELHECEDGPAVISTGAPTHWRKRLAARGALGRAFSGLRVLIPPGLPPPLDSATMARMLGAGGGVAMVKSGPSAAKGCHLGVVPPGFKQEDKLVASLRAADATVVAPAYVVDWVAHPQASLAQHYRHGTTPGEALVALERDRGMVVIVDD